MRAYFFGNMYLSSIQQGIQAAHALHEMFVRFPERKQDGGWYLWEWATNHKTMILLNAGYGEEIRDLMLFFNNHRNPYPWAEFNEAPEALDGALTTIGIILPEEIYCVAREIRECPEVYDKIVDNGGLTTYVNEDGDVTQVTLDKWQFKLAARLNRYGMAK